MRKTISIDLGHFMPILVMKRAFDAHVSFIVGHDGEILYSCTIPLPDGEDVVSARVMTGVSGSVMMTFTTTKKVDVAMLHNAVRRELVMLLDAWDSMSEFDADVDCIL